MSTEQRPKRSSFGVPSASPHFFTGASNIVLTQPTFNVADNIILSTLPNHSIERLREIADWLSSINFRTVQLDTHSKSTGGTGQWFLRSSEFQRWTSGQNDTLWVVGTPGTGKTILSAIVVDYLSNEFQANAGVAVVLGYFRYADAYAPFDILASLVKQLVELSPQLPPYVEEIYDEHKRKATRLSESGMLRLFAALTQHFTKVYVVLDALDEAPDLCKARILGGLLSLPIALFITSRPLDLTSVLPMNTVKVVLDTQTTGDIRLVASKSLDDIPRLHRLLKGDDLLRSHILDRLTVKSRGMFLTVTLQVEALSKCNTKNSLRNAAERLPSDLDDIYMDALRRIQDQEKDDADVAIRAIVWLTHALRSLKTIELQHALAISSDRKEFNDDDLIPTELLVSLCCGLVVIDEESEIVRLAHYTAYDFFKRHAPAYFQQPKTYITSKCIDYLSTFNFKDLAGADKRTLYNFLQRGNFLKYAYTYWGYHAHSCYDEDGPPKVVTELILGIPKYPFLVQPRAGWPIVEDFWPCHLAAFFGLIDVLPLTEGLQYWRTSRKRTPLILAAEQGHVEIVEYILSQGGVNVNAMDVSGRTALHEATLYSHEAIVRLLLSHRGLDINIKSRPGRTVLHEACRVGHEAIFRMLLSHPGVDVNAEGKSGRTALHEAAEMGHIVIIKELLSLPDIGVTAKDTFGNTALDEAIRYGREPVVKLLSDTCIYIEGQPTVVI
ncbi:hypothetical protein CVT26_005041 [Gymnopilus dilepis]|uniref:Uncharacterized protein n=1 Tax=Gymnopilus dilepis TaxID=231916 RepID=A0A409Y002_9AGAR|nr:hypothetical protein CVT26_005041 [Gymnopilus dilepis]